MGSIEEKNVRSPESISYEAHAHCLVGSPATSDSDEARCWDELMDILEGCSRMSGEALRAELREPGTASSEARRAAAREHFVACLAEWVNIHDLHKPYAMGPPGKDQQCAHVDDAHSTKERVYCNKLFPRKLIQPGEEEVAEDPRRHDLYRLRMARNCHFIHNVAPCILMARLSGHSHEGRGQSST